MFAWKLKRQWDFRNCCWSLHKFSGPNTTYVVKKYEKLQSKILDMGVSARVGTGKWMWNSGRAPLPMSSQFTCCKIECMSINGHNVGLGLCDVPLIHVFCAQPLWLKWIQREFIFSELHSHWPSSPAVKLIAWNVRPISLRGWIKFYHILSYCVWCTARSRCLCSTFVSEVDSGAIYFFRANTYLFNIEHTNIWFFNISETNNETSGKFWEPNHYICCFKFEVYEYLQWSFNVSVLLLVKASLGCSSMPALF